MNKEIKFLPVKINQIFALENYHFHQLDYNIDWLCRQQQRFEDYQVKTAFFHQAALLCEKFHSYIHYEQSYCHLQLAKLFLIKEQCDEALEQLDAAIFQDHINLEAHYLLIKLCKKKRLTKKLEQASQYAAKLKINFKKITNYCRPYKKFQDYLLFATKNSLYKQNLNEEQQKIACPFDYYLKNNENWPNLAYKNLWECWFDYNKNSEHFKLSKLLIKIKDIHLDYHISAANIYYNRHLLFKAMGEDVLANNDMVKARNLNENLDQYLAHLEL
jgi:hypothetical protein